MLTFSLNFDFFKSHENFQNFLHSIRTVKEGDRYFPMFPLMAEINNFIYIKNKQKSVCSEL